MTTSARQSPKASHLLAALTATAVLLVPGIAVAAVPAPHAFEGTCLGQGHASFAPPVKLLPAPGTGALAARIACTGRLDGQPVTAAPADVSASFAGTTSCFIPNSTRGPGTITFLRGDAMSDPVLHFTLTLPFHPALVLIDGAQQGLAVASAIITGVDQPLTACATTGVSGTSYQLALQTLGGAIQG
jgi:hypothetical protein